MANVACLSEADGRPVLSCSGSRLQEPFDAEQNALYEADPKEEEVQEEFERPKVRCWVPDLSEV